MKKSKRPNLKLMLGDCLDKLPKIATNSIHLTVTSPPYDNLRVYNENDNWGDHIWKPCIEELYRVTSEGGVVVWIVNDATQNGSETGTSFRQALHAKDCGFRLHDTMIWNKTGLSFPESNRYYPQWEYMFILSNGKPKTVNLIEDRKNELVGQTRVSNLERNPKGGGKRPGRKSIVREFGVRYNIWKISNTGGNKFGHPALFPIQLATDHIISWSNKGDRVLDPFMGSGTTGVACKKLGRKFVGIELNGEYFEIAKKRIEEA